MDAVRAHVFARSPYSVSAVVDHCGIHYLRDLAIFHRETPTTDPLNMVSRCARAALFPRCAGDLLDGEWRRTGLGTAGDHGGPEIARDTQAT